MFPEFIVFSEREANTKPIMFELVSTYMNPGMSTQSRKDRADFIQS